LPRSVRPGKFAAKIVLLDNSAKFTVSQLAFFILGNSVDGSTSYGKVADVLGKRKADFMSPDGGTADEPEWAGWQWKLDIRWIIAVSGLKAND